MNYLGIEIGGTKLQLAVGPGDGKIKAQWRGEVNIASGPEGIRQQITTAVPELLALSQLDCSNIQGVGIGFGGPVDDISHTIIKSHQIDGWDNFPLAQWIEDILQLPAVLGNDADVGGLAEALFGAGKGQSPIFYITIGSGIGGGFIIKEEIYRGCGRGAAEIGHLRVAASSQGLLLRPLEEKASGWAIGEKARAEAATGDRGAGLLRLVEGKWERLTALHVGQAAAQGDDFALSLLLDAWNSLADAIGQVIVLLCPRRIIIGGGVSLMGEHLFTPLRKLVADRVFEPFANCYDIVPAALGEEVVVQGALALARRHFSHQA